MVMYGEIAKVYRLKTSRETAAVRMLRDLLAAACTSGLLLERSMKFQRGVAPADQLVGVYEASEDIPEEDRRMLGFAALNSRGWPTACHVFLWGGDEPGAVLDQLLETYGATALDEAGLRQHRKRLGNIANIHSVSEHFPGGEQTP